MERIRADADDLHSIGQKPVTFLRQVLALATHPVLLSSPAFPDDAKARAARIIDRCYGNSIGSYTEGLGIDVIRQDVADYITRRDGGIECEADDVFLSSGAADAFTSVLTLLATEMECPNQAGILIPSPGYPIIRDLVTGLNSYPVFQQSVFGSGVEFHSFKKVLVSLGEPYELMELASIMSASKGIIAECGVRGGYCEFFNLDPDIKDQMTKFIAKTCAPVSGQIAVDVVVNPPKPSDPSYTLFQQETGEILSGWRMQAATITRSLNAVEGISCVEPAAASFLFPRIELPLRAIQEAKDRGLEPDEFYCVRLLEETGISLKPGTEFGQRHGHHHLRLTMLPSLVQMEKLLERLVDFHQQFLSIYSSNSSP